MIWILSVGFCVMTLHLGVICQALPPLILNVKCILPKSVLKKNVWLQLQFDGHVKLILAWKAVEAIKMSEREGGGENIAEKNGG